MIHLYRQISDSVEHCFNIQVSAPLTAEEFEILKWLLAETFEQQKIGNRSFLSDNQKIVEVGPRMNFATAWSTNAAAICYACGLTKIARIERSRRYVVPQGVDTEEFINNNHDRMTECYYPEPLTTFEKDIKSDPVFIVPLIEEGIDALRRINDKMGLGMDGWDIGFYYDLFVNYFKRNPTNVECFGLGQANSEHSRHWFFKGKLIIDGREIVETLMDIVKAPIRANPANSVIAFRDNSSAIRGYNIFTVIPEKPGTASAFKKENLTYHIIFTAETHNFPSGVAPFPGAETGTGGRIRDVHATGRGALVVAGTAGYCVGNLNIPGYELPWEERSFDYPTNLASPLEIEIGASDGASDYGNKFGEPVIQGFTRSFGIRLPDGERREWVKPIMFTGGIGQIDAMHIEKGEPQKGMLIVQIGGPAYRIGMGGGAASSMIQGQNIAELDFNAVQRGDAEMEQKMNRVIGACVEMGDKNPIISIHDQGAGGPCNVLTELVNPAGGKIEIRNITLGDNTLSVLEIWGAEYQERDALLISPDRIEEFEVICRREKVSCEVLGEITGEGRIVVHGTNNELTPVDLELSKILGSMPQKTFESDRMAVKLEPLTFPGGVRVKEALYRVLRLLSVGSKRFLTNKVDRSVTGLIAQQQCCGPLQLTVSDVAVVAQSHFGLTGAAIAIGEQPTKMLLNPAPGARMAVAEALTNIVWAKVSALEHIKCSANWMWAAKLPGEGAKIYDAAVAMRDIMIELGIAVDGGKDSLSMAAKIDGETVKAPGQLVVSAYATMDNIEKVVTPDIKKPGESVLLFVDLAKGKNRLGGSALAQVYGQVGNESPDVEDPDLLKHAFWAVQELISKDLILAGHDRSDGGLIVTLLEMAFSGNCGIKVTMKSQDDPLDLFFSEELGLLMECLARNEKKVISVFENFQVPCSVIGVTTNRKDILVSHNRDIVLNDSMQLLRSIWEETSYQIEKLQMNPECADKEKENIHNRSAPRYELTFTPRSTSPRVFARKKKPKVAVIREEGSNG